MAHHCLGRTLARCIAWGISCRLPPYTTASPARPTCWTSGNRQGICCGVLPRRSLTRHGFTGITRQSSAHSICTARRRIASTSTSPDTSLIRRAHHSRSKYVHWNVQDNGPLLTQTRAVGHAQRANYLYAGAADLFLEGGECSLPEDPVNDLAGHCGYEAIRNGRHGLDSWLRPPTRRLGATIPEPTGRTESGRQSDIRYRSIPSPTLPAQRRSLLRRLCSMRHGVFLRRMLRATGQAKYADLLEKELFNGILSGISQDGKRFFYTNKLSRLSEDVYQMDARRRTGSSLLERLPDKKKHFPPRMNPQCCPPNYARLLAMSPGMAYGLTRPAESCGSIFTAATRSTRSFRNGKKAQTHAGSPGLPLARFDPNHRMFRGPLLASGSGFRPGPIRRYWNTTGRQTTTAPPGCTYLEIKDRNW